MWSSRQVPSAIGRPLIASNSSSMPAMKRVAAMPNVNIGTTKAFEPHQVQDLRDR